MGETLNFEIPEGIGLRTELSIRALAFARDRRLCTQETAGEIPGVIFGQDELRSHGNFHPASYRRIISNPQWAKRLQKVHTAFKRSRARADWNWRELDCAHSSDALLGAHQPQGITMHTI
jgi:hypothetical protein